MQYSFLSQKGQLNEPVYVKMQSLQTAPLENDRSKDTPSELNKGLDFSAVYALNSQKCSEFGQELTRFILSSFLPKERLGHI